MAHSSIEAGKYFQHPDNTNLVLLAVSNERELLKAHEKLKDLGVKTRIFWECDDNLGFTAFATEPIEHPRRVLFAKYQLWREENVIKQGVPLAP